MLEWLQEVANTPVNNQPYVNPVVTVLYSDGADEDDSDGWGGGESDFVDDAGADGVVSADFTGLRIITRDDVVGTDGADQPQEKTGSDEKVGTDQKQYVIRIKPKDDDGGDTAKDTKG